MLLHMVSHIMGTTDYLPLRAFQQVFQLSSGGRLTPECSDPIETKCKIRCLPFPRGLKVGSQDGQVVLLGQMNVGEKLLTPCCCYCCDNCLIVL